MGDDSNKPFFQKIFENTPILFAIGVSLPLVFYFLWGLIEILTLGDMPSFDFGGQ